MKQRWKLIRNNVLRHLKVPGLDPFFDRTLRIGAVSLSASFFPFDVVDGRF